LSFSTLKGVKVELPLSPLLFLIVAKSLSPLLSLTVTKSLNREAKNRSTSLSNLVLTVTKSSNREAKNRSTSLSNLVYDDDILMFCDETNTNMIKEIMDLYYLAIGM
jgi:hypothetical protein